MLRHTKKITAPLAKNTSTFELSFTKKFTGTRDWQLRRNYPELGLGVFYVDYNCPTIYGQVFGIVPLIRLRLITTPCFSWSLRGGMGLAYDTKPYERVPNPNLQNETVGSHANNLTPMQTDLRFSVNKYLDFQAGAHLIHVSNASFRRPNFGINIWGFQVGLRYFPMSSTPERIHRDLPVLSNRILVYPKLAISYIEQGIPDGGLSRVYNCGVYATKRYLGKNKAILGIDYTYNTATYSAMKYNFRHIGEENRWASQGSVYFGNEFEFNRVGIVLQGGLYLWQMDQQKASFYEKIGANFYFLKQEKGLVKEGLISVLLKANKTNAELLEFGISFGF